MNRKEIEKKKAELIEILNIDDASQRLEKLKTLAQAVGASVTRIESVQLGQRSGRNICESKNIITETEIVHNIQVALQTETMIDMCKTSGRYCWVAIIASVIALLSMLAAWAAVCVGARCGK